VSTPDSGLFLINLPPRPTITNALPDAASAFQTLQIVVDGTNFVPGITQLLLGDGIEITSSIVESSTRLRATINVYDNAAIGARDIVVTNLPGGGSDTLHNRLTINYPAPRIFSSSPGSVRQGQTIYLYVDGSRFLQDVTQIQFGEGIKVNSVLFDWPSRMRANLFALPGARIGWRDITVANPAPGGGADTLKNAFKVIESSGVEDITSGIPLTYRLHNAYPNPFNPATRIQFDLPEPSQITIDIFNTLGVLIERLAEGIRGAGTYALNWHAGQNPSGVYIIRLRAISSISAKQLETAQKIVLLK
jgi:hypothetical protein